MSGAVALVEDPRAIARREALERETKRLAAETAARREASRVARVADGEREIERQDSYRRTPAFKVEPDADLEAARTKLIDLRDSLSESRRKLNEQLVQAGGSRAEFLSLQAKSHLGKASAKDVSTAKEKSKRDAALVEELNDTVATIESAIEMQTGIVSTKTEANRARVVKLLDAAQAEAIANIVVTMTAYLEAVAVVNDIEAESRKFQIPLRGIHPGTLRAASAGAKPTGPNEPVWLYLQSLQRGNFDVSKFVAASSHR